MTPRLPKEWNKMALRKIRSFSTNFDIEIERIENQTIRVILKKEGKIIMNKKTKNGTILNCNL